MKKQNLIILIILLLISAVSIYFITSNQTTEPEGQLQENQTQETVESGMPAMEAEKMMEDEKEVMMEEKITPEVPDTAVEYQLNQATVSYTAQKRFLKKADETVTGTTTTVTGDGWYCDLCKSFFFSGSLDFTDLATDNEKRDSDVVKMLDDTGIAIELFVEEAEELVMGEQFSLEIPLMLTINGVKRSEIFEVTGLIDNGTVTASGETQIRMSDFAITPPSLIDIFTVDDDIIISFELEGTALGTEQP